MTDKKAGKGKDKAVSKDEDGKQAWARLTASAKKLTGETRNRHVPEPEPVLKKGVQKRTQNSEPGSTAQNPISTPAMARASKQKVMPPLPSKPTPQEDLQLRTRRRLSRGTIALDGKIDLHGLTLVEAEAALASFVKRAQTQNQIWLLVVTGKGTRGEGKLRRALPDWLDRGGLAGRVVEYGPAAPNHGGGGAFYLRLRRIKAQ